MYDEIVFKIWYRASVSYSLHFALVRLVGMFMLPWQPSPKLTIEKYVGCIKLLISKTAHYFSTEILHEDVEP